MSRTFSTTTLFTIMPSPIGPLCLTSEGEGLAGVFTNAQKDGPTELAGWKEERALFGQAIDELTEYFAGTRTVFEVPLKTSAGTDFQREVWQALKAIRCGATVSYADIANDVGRPRAVRAVGGAVGLNPWAIIVPCHRVVGSAGALTGFAGGLPRKRWLLEHEGVKIGGGKSETDPKARIVGKQLSLIAM